MNSTLRVAILGAPGSGKTQLAQHLLATFPSRLVLEDAPAPGAWRQRFDLGLLMGLDLHPAHHPAAHRQIDQELRATLAQQALPFALVYGRGAARGDQAAQAIRFHLRDTAGMPEQPSRWRWPCDKCSDPECEHRLFSALLPGN